MVPVNCLSGQKSVYQRVNFKTMTKNLRSDNSGKMTKRSQKILGHGKFKLSLSSLTSDGSGVKVA